jgi:hypothetical protein
MKRTTNKPTVILPVIFNDVPNAIPFWTDGTKTKQSQRRIAAIRSTQNGIGDFLKSRTIE